jgi:hypothetical protein
MLMCRGCSTRFDSSRQACPSCGRPAKLHAVEANASDSGSGLPPPPPVPEDDLGADLDLGGPMLEEDPPELEVPEKEEVAPLRSRPARAPVSPRPPKPARAASPRKSPAAPSFSLDPAQVRALLVDQPVLLEKGLRVHAGGDGKPLGIDFETPVGDIDLLARDPRGGFVIVLVPEEEDDADLVPGLLRRMGWVRKHLCSGGETVRAVAVMNDVPESATYAAAGLAEGVIRFVGYRIAVEFHDQPA